MEVRCTSKNQRFAPLATDYLPVVHCIRTDNDITQDEVAKTMHTSRTMIRQLEAGRRRMELAELILLARALKTTPEIIFKMIMT